jgi:hypothetical protein
MAGSARFTTVLSRKATVDTKIATTNTLVVGAASRNFTCGPRPGSSQASRDHCQLLASTVSIGVPNHGESDSPQLDWRALPLTLSGSHYAAARARRRRA